MGKKHTEAARERQSRYTPAELSARMSAIRKSGWAKKSPEERAKVGRRLTRARKHSQASTSKQ